jgi:Asp-tRNA(Asn)/Glu-tRNA(Gln) amidotransferase A subunit family amidase
MTNPNARSAGNSGAGVLELLRLFKGDDAAAEQYASTCRDKARTVEPVLKAFEYLPVDIARKPGPLSGVPVAIKDIIATADMPTTNGSPVYKDCIPDADAWVVERLRNLGATIFGKTVSTEFAWRHPGPTVNPWNQKHTPGGSSSGSAAAVAAGIVPLALGTQTLGSIIRPAAFNGVVGLKPSFGAIPRTGVHPLSPSLDHVGFFARCVDDVACVLSLLVGTSDSDIHGRPVPAFEVSIEQGLAPLPSPRLAIVRFAKWSKAEREQQQVFEAAVATLRDAGAILQELELPELDHSNWSTVNAILASEAALIFGDLVERFPDRTSDHLKELVRIGKAHCRQSAAGETATSSLLGTFGLRRRADPAGVRRSPRRPGLYRRRGILCALDLGGDARRVAAGRIRQKASSARPPNRWPLSGGLSDASGGEMDRECLEV